MRTIAEHILDIVQNSLRAKATLIEIMVDEDKNEDFCNIEIKDNGGGMDKDILDQATDPFFTSRNTRKIGLGLSLLMQNAEKVGGTFSIHSEKDKGTSVKAVFQLSNIDRAPFGEIADIYLLLVAGNKDLELNYIHRTNYGLYELHSKELFSALGDISPYQKEMKEAIIEMIENNLKEIEKEK